MIIEPRATPSTYIGLSLVALSTLMYEILLTRIFSVTMLYHFAFVALSVAMFGMTVGALLVYLLPSVFTPARLQGWLAGAAIAFPIAMLLSFLTELSVPFRIHPSVVAIYAIVFTYAVIAVPFIVSGIVVCLALTGFPSRVSRLYAADLAGAALGCVLVIPVLDYSDGPTAVLWVAWLASLGAVAFAWPIGDRGSGIGNRARAGARSRCRPRCSRPRRGTRSSSGSTFRSSASCTSRGRSRRARSTRSGTRPRASA